jgi:uncharacterized protein YdcH (DUF465 family)
MENHDLLHVFPEYQEKIVQLKTEDVHFSKLFDEYHKTKGEVFSIKTEEVITTDEYLKELKVKLLHLKDEIYHILKG